MSAKQDVGSHAHLDIADVIGRIPYRMAFAVGWIDQSFVSRLNPSPPGSMVVVALDPAFPFMDRCGMGTSTRKVAMRLWNGALPQLLTISRHLHRPTTAHCGTMPFPTKG